MIMSVWLSKPKNGQGARHNQNRAISIPCVSRLFFHARKSPSKLLHIFRHSSPTASQDQGDTPNEWFHRKQAPPFARIPRPSSGIISFRSPITFQPDELRPLFPPQLDALHAAASLRRRKGPLGQISVEHPLYRRAECAPSVGARA